MSQKNLCLKLAVLIALPAFLAGGVGCKPVVNTNIASTEGPDSSFKNSFRPSDPNAYWGSLEMAAQRVSKMQSFVIESVRSSFEQDGNKGYAWGDGESGFTGMTTWGKTRASRPLGEFKGSAADPRSHCSGVTLQIVMEALNRYDRWSANSQLDPWNGISQSQFTLLEDCWWMKPERQAICDRNGPQTALVEAGIGRPVTFSELQPGDFGQVWRQKSGHTVVFLQYILADRSFSTQFDPSQVVGFQYFSTSGFTNGVGILNAYISDPAALTNPDLDTRCKEAKKNDPFWDCPFFLDTVVTLDGRAHESSFVRLLTPQSYSRPRYDSQL